VGMDFTLPDEEKDYTEPSAEKARGLFEDDG
jgi:hypothetical protein